MPLTDGERKELNALLGTGTPLPEKWLHRLFPNGRKAESVAKEYRLVYEGKLTREEVPAQTPDAEALREYILDHYLVLYAQIDANLYPLAIRHHRQLSFDFQSHWGGTS